ncbi:MAG: hypothetical protein CTY33_00310 [Methylotenera sp.]|nr:MAG: hypothetical protein CTY33_00310 [Methylotenera sp.]
MLSVMHDGIEYRFYNHLLAASSCGKFLRKLIPLAPTIRKDGYATVGRQLLAHRVVASVWLNKPDNATLVHHINHNKADNRAINLEWVSPKEHVADRHHGISKGHKMSDAGKQRLREFRTGIKLSDATKQKQREANLRLGIKPPPRAKGSKCTEDAIDKMRLNSPNASKCSVDGVVYNSYSEASRATGVLPHTIRKRCLSKNFNDYKILA